MIPATDGLAWLVRLLVIAALAYVAVIGALYLAQTWLVFPTGMVPSAGPPLPPGAERLEVVTPEGERLRGVRIPAARDSGAERRIILGFGGNAWHGDSVALYLRELYPTADVVAFQFRGYRPSTGKPSAAALLADGATIFDHLAEGGAVPVTAIGFSIGAGVAAHVASKRPVRGLILVTPFDSLEAVAADLHPWAPVRLLFRHPMPTVDFVRERATPTAVIAAERDTIVPPRRTEALRRAIPNLVLDRTIAGVGHNEIYHHAEFRQAMAEAFALVTASPAAPRAK